MAGGRGKHFRSQWEPLDMAISTNDLSFMFLVLANICSLEIDKISSLARITSLAGVLSMLGRLSSFVVFNVRLRWRNSV